MHLHARALALSTVAATGPFEIVRAQEPVELPVVVIEAEEPDADAADRAGDVVVDRTDLVRRNPTTVREVFAGEAAISVGGGIGPSQKLYVNGIEETNLAVTVDGSAQNRKIFHHTGNNLIDPRLLKAVRVDPGVAPADAGFGALAGSVAYETADAADLLEPGRDFGAELETSFETNGATFSNSATAYGRWRGFDGLVFTRYAFGDDYEAGGGGDVDGTGANLLSYLLKGAWTAPGGHRFELSAEGVSDDAERPFRANIGALPGRPDPVVRDYQLVRRNYVFTYETTSAQGLFDPKLVVAWNEARTDVPVPFASTGKAGGWSAKLENRFALGERNSVTAGVDFRTDFGSYSDPSTPELEERATTIGAYAQARLRPVESVGVSLGGRADAQTFEGVDGSETEEAGLSGNVSAEWQATRFLSFSAGYSNVFGGIALNEPFIFNPAWSYTDLEPVRAQNYVAGVDVEHMGFTVGASVFRTDFENARDANFSAGAYQSFDFRSEGWKAHLGYAWGAGFVRLTYVDADVTSGGQVVDSDALTYFGAQVGRMFALEAAHELEGTGVALGLSAEAALEYDEPEEIGLDPLEAYQVVGAFIEYQPPQAQNLSFRISATNLFDERYASRTTYGQEFGVVEPLRERGRSFQFTGRLRF